MDHEFDLKMRWLTIYNIIILVLLFWNYEIAMVVVYVTRFSMLFSILLPVYQNHNILL